MASFSKDDLASAKQAGKVLVTVSLDGKAVPGFPYQRFTRTGLVPPAAARGLIRSVEAVFDEEKPDEDPAKKAK